MVALGCAIDEVLSLPDAERLEMGRAGREFVERHCNVKRETAKLALWIDEAVDHTDAALLVLHGGRDPLITLEQQRPFLKLSRDSTLQVWDDGEHTIYNHSAERTELVSDWFRSRLA